MPSKMQEKFQRVVKQNTNEQTDRWADFSSARHVNHVPDVMETTSMKHHRTTPPVSFGMSRNNEMPPGYDIDAQHGHNGDWRALSVAGSTDISGEHCDSAALMRGYCKKPMSPVDDMYTDEHRDDFYDDVGGFVERANYLDRL